MSSRLGWCWKWCSRLKIESGAAAGRNGNAFFVTILGEDRMGTFFEGQRFGYVCELTG